MIKLQISNGEIVYYIGYVEFYGKKVIDAYSQDMSAEAVIDYVDVKV